MHRILKYIRKIVVSSVHMSHSLARPRRNGRSFKCVRSHRTQKLESWVIHPNSTGTVAALSRHSRGTVAALSRHCGGTLAALWRHSRGTVAALSRHCGGTLVALWRHSHAALSWHPRGTVMALSWHCHGTLVFTACSACISRLTSEQLWIAVYVFVEDEDF